MRVSIFMPVLNEIEGLKKIIPQINRELVDEIVVIDGNSNDGSFEYLQSQENIICERQKDKGLFSAWWQGFELCSGEFIIVFSPDGNSSTESIPALINEVKKGYDIVIASRYLNKNKSEDDFFASMIANKFFTCLINIFFKGKISDGIGMYKIFNRKLLKELDLYKNKDDIFDILITIRSLKYKIKMAEILSVEGKRIGKQGSKAWPGIRGRLKGAIKIAYLIFREKTIK